MMGAGRLFGGIPWVQRHFEAVILVIILISVLPAVFEFLKARRQGKNGL
jgi:membrane-associated protein